MIWGGDLIIMKPALDNDLNNFSIIQISSLNIYFLILILGLKENGGK